jgi:hypothetical protein
METGDLRQTEPPNPAHQLIVNHTEVAMTIFTLAGKTEEKDNSE